MTVDHQKVVGNLSPMNKQRVVWDGDEYVFDYPGVEHAAAMERVCEEAARRRLIQSKEFLSPEDYSRKSVEFLDRQEGGYFRAPKGEGFLKFYDPTGHGGIQAIVAMVYCLVCPNRPGFTLDAATKFVSANQDEIMLVLAKIMPPDRNGAADPKATGG